MKESIKVTRVDHCNRLFLSSHTLVNEVTSYLKSSLSCSLTISGLKHIKLTVLNCKLHILHISIVLLKCSANFIELLESLWELISHLINVHRCTNTCNYVLALCIGKEFSEKSLSACSRVSCKCNTCTAVITHVTKCHRLYVNSCSPGIRDIVVTTVNIGTRVIPRTEYCLDCSVKLFLWIGREVLTNL